MSNNSNHYIQSVSYAKLAEYDQTRTDLPIRKYVLIANLLREEQLIQQEDEDSSMTSDQDNKDEDEDMLMLEQQWFETCLNELVNEEEEEEAEQEDSKENGQYKHNDYMKNDKLTLVHKTKYCTTQQRIQLHAIYDIHSRRGILLCTSSI